MFIKVGRCPSFKTFALFISAWFIILIVYLLTWDSSPPEVSISNSNFENQEGKFQEVEKDEMYTVSAYFDNRTGGPVIRVMGVGSLHPGQVACVHHDEDCRRLETIRVEPTLLYKKTKEKLQGIWIKCPISEKLKKENAKPKYISVSGSRTSFHKISYPAHSFKYGMALCVQPFFNNWENPLALIEWIEFHRMLGVEHFTFYNQSLGEKSAKVLDSYGDLVTLLPWDLGFDPALTQNKAQVIQVNDCMYRYMGVAEIVGSVDLDEFIIPGKYWLRLGRQGFPGYYKMFKNIQMRYSEKDREVSAIRFESKFAFDHFPKRNGSLYLTNEIEFDLTPVEENLANRLQILTRVLSLPSTKFSYKRKYVAFPHLNVEYAVHYPTPGLKKKVIDARESEVHFMHFRTCNPLYLLNYSKDKRTTCANIRPLEESDAVVKIFGVQLFRMVEKRVKSLLQTISIL